MKKMISLFLSVVMLMSLSIPASAATSASNDASVIEDTTSTRIATCGEATAILDKNTNIIYVKDETSEYSFSIDISSIPAPINSVIESESVVGGLYKYQYNKADNGSYYWSCDIPSLDINPNNWCGWISVWDNGSVEAEMAEEFADYIEAAKVDENTILTYAGATGLAVIVGAVSKNPIYSESAFKAICAAAGIVVGYGLLDAASSYYSNVCNSRDKYFGIREIIG